MRHDVVAGASNGFAPPPVVRWASRRRVGGWIQFVRPAWLGSIKQTGYNMIVDFQRLLVHGSTVAGRVPPCFQGRKRLHLPAQHLKPTCTVVKGLYTDDQGQSTGLCFPDQTMNWLVVVVVPAAHFRIPRRGLALHRRKLQLVHY